MFNFNKKNYFTNLFYSWWRNLFFELVVAAMVLKKLLEIFAIFIGFITDFSFGKSEFGTKVAELFAEIGFRFFSMCF